MKTYNPTIKYILLPSSDEQITDDGVSLHYIQAVRDFGDVKKGDIGGMVESEKNLSHEGDCWIYCDTFIRSQKSNTINLEELMKPYDECDREEIEHIEQEVADDIEALEAEYEDSLW